MIFIQLFTRQGRDLTPRQPSPVPNAEAIEDPELFVRLVFELLSIFPNKDRAVDVLNRDSDVVTPMDEAVVRNVVEQLRTMLRKTPLEKRRQARRKTAQRFAAWLNNELNVSRALDNIRGIINAASSRRRFLV